MDSLPQEIYDTIASWLPGPSYNTDGSVDASKPSPRPAIATVSKKFQSAIERLTFGDIRINGNELPDFKDKFDSPKWRRNFLSALHFLVELPYPDSIERPIWNPYETESERQQNSQGASQKLRLLLYFLSQWEVGKGIQLHISFMSPGSPDEMAGELRTTWGDISQYSFIELSDVEHMQMASCVGLVNMVPTYASHRHLTPKSSFALATRFPRARELRICWNDPFGFKAFRRNMRQEFLRSLKEFRRPSTLRNLWIISRAPFLAVVEGPPLPATDENGNKDALNSTLHHAVGNLESLSFFGEVDASLFWPYPSDNPEPFWQSLKAVDIVMELTAPSGEYYFSNEHYELCERRSKDSRAKRLQNEGLDCRPPGYGSRIESNQSAIRAKNMDRLTLLLSAVPNDDQGRIDYDLDASAVDSRIFRVTSVNRPAMTALLEALIKAMAQMRSIERLSLSVTEKKSWGMEFYAPRVRSSLDKYIDSQESDDPQAHARIYISQEIWIPSTIYSTSSETWPQTNMAPKQ